MADMLRVYPAYIKGEPEKVLSTDQTFIQIWAALSCSRTDAINRIFEEGLAKLADSSELEGRIDGKSLAIFRKWQEIQTKISEKSQLELIYEHSALDEFQTFCDKHEIDHEDFLRVYRLDLPTSRAKSKVMEDWIRYMLSDGDERSVQDIKYAAEIEGVATNDDDWNLMKNIASQKGYSGNAKRGYWKLD